MKKNKNCIRFIKISLIILCLIFLLACEGPKLFEAPADMLQDRESMGPDGPELVWVHITGGFAGVNQTLSLWQNGFTLLEGYYGAAARKVMLEQSEVNSIINMFLANDFFHLDGQYLSEPRVADAFLYEIRFDYGGVSNTVVTDGFAGPESLKKIVTTIHKFITKIVQATPKIELSVNRTQLAPGDTLTIRLAVTNPTNQPMVLHFSSAQVYDFIISDNSTDETDSNVIWNWAFDKMFAAVLTDLTLLPGEVRVYEEIWGGRDNNGKQVQGKFLVSAQLVGMPGGTSEEIAVTFAASRLVTRSVVTYGDSLRITISVPDSIFPFGKEVEITMEAENISAKTLWVPVGGDVQTVQVRRADDNQVVWEPLTFDLGTQKSQVSAGSKTQFSAKWCPATERYEWSIVGEYLIQGRMFDKPTGTLRIRLIN